MKYFFCALCIFLTACGTSRYPDLHTVPDHLDVSDQKSSCASDKAELEVIECS